MWRGHLKSLKNNETTFSTKSWLTLWEDLKWALNNYISKSQIYDHMFYTFDTKRIIWLQSSEKKINYMFVFSSAKREESAVLLCWPIVQSHEGKSALLCNTLPSTSLCEQEDIAKTLIWVMNKRRWLKTRSTETCLMVFLWAKHTDVRPQSCWTHLLTECLCQQWFSDLIMSHRTCNEHLHYCSQARVF